MRRVSLHTRLRRASGRGGSKVKRGHPEEDLQIALVSMLVDVLKPGVVMAHVPNQGVMLVQYREKLKRMGLLEGYSDLVFHFEGKTYFLELKSATGSMRPGQKRFKLNVEATGFEYALARTIDAGIEQCKAWGLINPKFQIATRSTA